MLLYVRGHFINHLKKEGGIKEEVAYLVAFLMNVLLKWKLIGPFKWKFSLLLVDMYPTNKLAF